MLHFFRFNEDVPAPEPARPVYGRRKPGRGRPEECPPMRAANAFGWDVLSATDMVFLRGEDGSWRLEQPVELESDWLCGPEGEMLAAEQEEDEPGEPLRQRNAWFWEKGQQVPHVISDEVYEEIRNQVKVSTFLFLWTDPNELLYLTEVPNRTRPWRVLSALVDTDWYPASYPWHAVLELDPAHERIEIARGEPICRLFTVRRDTYFAREASDEAFAAYFNRSQRWLAEHGKGQREGLVVITGAYRKLQRLSQFVVDF